MSKARAEDGRGAAQGRDSRLLLEEAARIARVGGWEIDLDRRTLDWTRVVHEIHEVDPGFQPTVEAAIGFYAPEAVPVISEAVRRAVDEGEPFDLRLQLITARNRRLWVRAKGEAIREDGRITKVRGVFQDVDAATRVEAALAESEARLQAVFDGVSDGLLVADLEGRRFILANRAMCEASGYSREELLAMGVDRLHPPEALPYVRGWFERQVRGEEVVAPDIPVLRKDGRVVVCDVGSAIVVVAGRPCLMGSFRDATWRRRHEQLSRMNQLVFRSAMSANSIADLSGSIIDANEAFLRTWGFERLDQVLGRKVPDFLAYEHEARVILEALDRTGSWEGEYTAVRGDGSTFLARSLATVVRDEAGRVIGYQSAVVDVTERARAEEEKERLRAQLVQAQKMESIGRLAGGVAHDFNNMLGVILGYLDLLLGSTPEGDPNRSIVLGIRTAAERSAEMTRQLLAFARKQTVSPRVLDLNAAVSGSLGMLRRLIGEDVSLDWQPAPALWPVRIDPSQVDQILANLCVNARDAIEGTGRITITTANRQVQGTAGGGDFGPPPGDHVQISVVDDGCGMGAEVLGHLFEPFFTTKGVGRGTGLGLATLYGIVKQNGGGVEVSSQPGRGSEIRVLLHRCEAAEAPPPPAAPAADLAPPRDATVLLVEDEPLLLEVCRAMLQSTGYRVLAAATPSAAEALLDQEGAGVDLLVTDLVMPESDGVRLADRLRARCPGLKVLFLSGYSANALARDGLLPEGIRFLQKPFSHRDLAAAVRATLDDAPMPAPESHF